jgi:hypothetical protein
MPAHSPPSPHASATCWMLFLLQAEERMLAKAENKEYLPIGQ